MATKKSAAKKASTKKAPAKKATGKKAAARKSTTPPSRRWSAKVKTDSTKPGPGLFKKSAKAIASGLAKKSVSPKGPGQAMQMLSFYENRGGKNLSASRKKALEGAKDILRTKEESAKKSVGKKAAAKKTAKKTGSKTSGSRKTAKKS